MGEERPAAVTAAWERQGGQWCVLVHGGAGAVARPSLVEHIAGCRRAAEFAARMLSAGASALDAAQKAVEDLEGDPRYNAGVGSCLNEEGRIELDAALMEGRDLRAGAVCALPPFRHPIAIARAVLDEGHHVLYAGMGAERFALAHGFRRASDAELTTDNARRRWERTRAGASAPGPTGDTVGAVVRDAFGNVAAATSTGGQINKRVGRVGDSPIFGAGTYADNDAGAASATGEGEAFLRLCLSKTALEWLRGGMAPEEAARGALRLVRQRVGGTGGIVLIDRFGRAGWARSTASMSWAAASEGWSDVPAGA